MFSHDDRDLNDHPLLEARRSASPSAGASRAVPPQAPTASAPVGLLERPEQPAAERPSPAAESKQQPGSKEPHAGEKAHNGFLRRHPIAAALGLLVLSAGGAGGYVYWDSAAYFQSTDDAFIAARSFSIAPKVAGYVTAVPVTDNEHVAAGGVIARIDDSDYRAALAQAQARVAAAEAGVRNVDAQLDVQQAQIAAAKAQARQAKAALTFAEQQAARAEALVQKGAGTVEAAQQTTSQLDQQRAAVASAEAAQTLAERQVEALKAQRATAEANLAEAKARRDQGELNLAHTTVRAAQAGRIVNLGAAVGQYVTPGTALASFVPDTIWVTANFKETQLDAMRPGQPATIAIDAYPHLAVHGHVASVQPGSGAAFSLLPPENATGNYVKIVQRVPVKIVMDDPPADVALGPGMSVVPMVRVDENPSLYERLKAEVARWRGRR